MSLITDSLDGRPTLCERPLLLKWSCSKWKQNYAELLGIFVVVHLINFLVNVEKKVQILIQMEARGGHWRRE